MRVIGVVAAELILGCNVFRNPLTLVRAYRRSAGLPEPAAVPLLDLIASILIWSPDGNPKCFHEGG